MTDNTTRRALFAGATLALAAPIAAAAAPLTSAVTFATGSGVSPLWIERDRLFNTKAATDDEGDANFDKMVAVENRILRGPVNSAADIAAQLRVVIYGMDVGLRSDRAERAAMVALVELLEGPVAPRVRLPPQFT
jgi:hypothetical protein